jgi:hypothetical protein
MDRSIASSAPSMAISPPPNRTVQDARDHDANVARSSSQGSPIPLRACAACATKVVAGAGSAKLIDAQRRSTLESMLKAGSSRLQQWTSRHGLNRDAEGTADSDKGRGAIERLQRVRAPLKTVGWLASPEASPKSSPELPRRRASREPTVLHYDEINSTMVPSRRMVSELPSSEISQSACYLAVLGGIYARRVNGLQPTNAFGLDPKGHYLEVGLMLEWGKLSKTLGRDCDRDRLDDVRQKAGKFIAALCHETSRTSAIFCRYHFSDGASTMGGPSDEKLDLVGFICNLEALGKNGLREMMSNVRQLGIRAESRGDGPAMRALVDLMALQLMDVVVADSGTHGLKDLNSLETDHRESLWRARAFMRSAPPGFANIRALLPARISATNSDIHRAKMMGWRQAAEQASSAS